MILLSIYSVILYIYISPILIQHGILPGSAKHLTDIAAATFVPVILIRVAITKEFYANRGYLIGIVLMLFIAVMGFIYNQTEAGAFIIGIRHHFKFWPFFLLPLVYDFKEKEIRIILYLLLCLLLLQLPVAFYQRFLLFAGIGTGDVVGGTITASGSLSIILVSAVSILFCYFLSGKIRLRTLVLLSCILLAPTAINETKITFVILPMSLAILLMLSGEEKLLRKLKKITTYCIITSVFAVSFIYVYDRIYGTKMSFLETIRLEQEGRGYLHYGDEKASERIQEGYRIGRFDSIRIAVSSISRDVGNLMIGIGIGNSLSSKIGFLKGTNTEILKYYPDMTTTSNVLWETGLLGFAVYLFWLFLIFKNSLALRGQDSFVGVFCAAWSSVTCIMFVTFFYRNILYSDALNITFWLLSGLVVSKSYQLKKMEVLATGPSAYRILHRNSV